ncbi:hypothetical protein GCM10009552_18930 [Rothia nasimurium]
MAPFGMGIGSNRPDLSPFSLCRSAPCARPVFAKDNIYANTGRAQARSYRGRCGAVCGAPCAGRAQGALLHGGLQAALRRVCMRTRPVTSAIRATEPSARMVAPEMPATRR